MTRWLDARAADFASGFDALLSLKREAEEDVAASVRAIIAEVRARGDAALIEFGERFDKVDLTPDTLRLRASRTSPPRRRNAGARRSPRSTSRPSASRIITAARLPADVSYTDELGAAARLALDGARQRGALRARRHGELSQFRPDERHPGGRGGRQAHRHGDAGQRRRHQSA